MGTNGVLLVGEALGASEAEVGLPFQGKAGQALDKMLARGGLNRADFSISNAIWCQPPSNKLTGEWYAKDSLRHCSPNLDGVIDSIRPRVIVCLGATAFSRVLPEVANTPGVGLLDSKRHKGARGYVFWSDRYSCWVIPTCHPSFIARGKTAWAQVLIHDVQRAVEISAAGAYAYSNPDYALDPSPMGAMAWAYEFEKYALDHPDLYLSCDIETPEKGADEEELDLEECSDYIILRVGYSFRDNHALSIPWGGAYSAVHARLLGHACQKCWWNGAYDQPRLLANGAIINGTSHDGLDAWHVLNSDLKKSLNFVTPFFCPGQKMWKHLSGSEPAYYNACDADAAGQNMRGTVKLLKQHGMWKVYEEFIAELDPVFSAMTRAGMPIDRALRVESSKQLISRRTEVRNAIEALVPIEIHNVTPKEGYKREPTDKTGLQLFTFNGVRNVYCGRCDAPTPTKAHFASYKRKLCPTCGGKWTAGHAKARRKGNPCAGTTPELSETNPCAGANAIERLDGEQRWARVQPFVASTKGIMRYQQYRKHPLIMIGRGEERKATTDIKAINTLIGKHPDDKFYPLVCQDREYTKLGGTYIGWFNDSSGHIDSGFPVGRDGRVHGVFRHTPSTLRSSMVSPNLQNLPRGNDSEVQRWVKQMFVAPSGYEFVARDYSGIEAVLVGLHAGDKEFMRLARLDIHSYFTAHNLRRLGVLTDADLPSLSWSDSALAAYLKDIKGRFKSERDIGKRCIHAGNYRVGPTKLHEEYPEWFHRVKDAAAVLSLFYEVFPKINEWHERLCLQVDRSAVVRNSFGHAHRFYQVLSWEKINGNWSWSYGDDAKRLIAFGPQSDAAFIGKRALKRCFYNYPDSMARWLRLFIHDELLTEVPKDRADEADSILEFEMSQPIPEMPLDPSWGFGSVLAITTEGKRGLSWSSMH